MFIYGGKYFCVGSLTEKTTEQQQIIEHIIKENTGVLVNAYLFANIYEAFDNVKFKILNIITFPIGTGTGVTIIIE